MVYFNFNILNSTDMFEIFKKLLLINKLIVVLLIVIITLAGLQFSIYDSYIDTNFSQMLNVHDSELRNISSKIPRDSFKLESYK
jgi:hypothetical protein